MRSNIVRTESGASVMWSEYARRAVRGSYLGPLDASRQVASNFKRASPRPENDGIGEPAFLHAGHCRWAIWNAMPLFFAPSAVNSGAPRFCPPAPRYTWQLRQP